MPSGKKDTTDDGARAEGRSDRDESLPRVRSIKLADSPLDARLSLIARFPPPEGDGRRRSGLKAPMQLVMKPLQRHPAPEPEPKAEKPDIHYELRQWSPRPKQAPAPSIGSMDPSRKKR